MQNKLQYLQNEHQFDLFVSQRASKTQFIYFGLHFATAWNQNPSAGEAFEPPTCIPAQVQANIHHCWLWSVETLHRDIAFETFPAPCDPSALMIWQVVAFVALRRSESGPNTARFLPPPQVTGARRPDGGLRPEFPLLGMSSSTMSLVGGRRETDVREPLRREVDEVDEVLESLTRVTAAVMRSS